MAVATGFSPSPPEPGRREPLGQILKRMELVTEAQIQEVLQIQRKRGGVIGQILLQLGYVAEEEVVLALAAQMHASVAEDREQFLQSLGGKLDALLREAKAWEDVTFEKHEEQTRNLPSDDLANSAPVVKLVNLVLLTALRAGATELRIEFEGDAFTVRYRVEGILYDMESPPLHLGYPMITRLMGESGMEITQRVRPQERRVRVTAEGRRVLARVHYRSDAPRGESIVLYFSEEGGASS